MSESGWPVRGFLNFVGLYHPGNDDGKPRSVELAEAAIDPRTGGAVSVTTKAELDGKNGVKHIKTYYWYMQPSGQQTSQELFDIELEQREATVPSADGKLHKIPIIVPHAVWVLGRKQYPNPADDGDYPEADMNNLNRILGAVGEVNRQLREGILPQVAQIFKKKEYAIQQAIGENPVLTGLSPNGGFDFDAADASGSKINGTLTVPTAVARALMGFGVNSLDEHQRLQPEIHMPAVDPRSGEIYTTEAHIDEGSNPKVSIAYAPAAPPHAVPRPLTNVAWESNGKSTLKDITLLGEGLTKENHLTRMRALGVTNHILHDLRKRRYPSTIDHLIEHDLYDLVKQFVPPPPLSEGGRLTMISVGGNNIKEIAYGFGESIGGNSKVVCHEGLNKDGKADRVGVIIDLGIHLSPKDEVNVSAAPDIIEHLKYCKDILITHRHLDHVDGLFAYMQAGYLKGKTVHATPEVIRAIRDKLGTYTSIHADSLPTFSPLKGEGWLHIKDGEGNTRLSVNYARNATPHTARCTPFFVHGHYKGKWIGSYLNHGDARYGRHNAEDYSGVPVDADHLNKKFFTESNRRFLEEAERLDPELAKRFDPKIADRGPTYFDIDITSVLKPGWGPTEPEVEENLTEISHWFPDKGMLLGMISTNENRLETAFRVATRSHRDLTVFGSNLEKTTTTANVLGVNDLRHEPEAGGNIQLYLDKYFEDKLTQKIAIQKDSLENVDGAEKEELEKKLARNEARVEAFETLRNIRSPNARYKMRTKLETELQERFGREATLGSLTEDYTDEGLGALHVGRASETSRSIMSMDTAKNLPGADGRRLALLTGTQNTNAEVDAALTALSEGRHPVLDGNPANSHTARPVVPENNVVVISQTAIPGNDLKQAELVRKLVSRGFVVVQALHEGFKIHNIDPERRKEITRRLDKRGIVYDDGEINDRSLLVYSMPIHAGGHGCKEDCRAWINLVKADVTAAQHTSNPKAVERFTEAFDGFSELCRAVGRRCMDRIVPNFEGLSLKAGDTPESTEILSLGHTLPSLIRIIVKRKTRQGWDGHMTAYRVTQPDDADAGMASFGLGATTRQHGPYTTAFATVDSEEVARMKARSVSRPEHAPEDRMPPPPERPDRGSLLPGESLRHRRFGESKSQSAAFVGR